MGCCLSRHQQSWWLKLQEKVKEQRGWMLASDPGRVSEEHQEGQCGCSHVKTKRPGSQRAWVTEGLVNHIENFGYHLKNDGKLSTGFGLGLMRSGSCFERAFLLFGVGVGGWPPEDQEWKRGARLTMCA